MVGAGGGRSVRQHLSPHLRLALLWGRRASGELGFRERGVVAQMCLGTKDPSLPKCQPLKTRSLPVCLRHLCSLPTAGYPASHSLSGNLPLVPRPLALQVPDLLGVRTASPYPVPVAGLPALPLLTAQDPGQGDLCVVTPSLTPQSDPTLPQRLYSQLSVRLVLHSMLVSPPVTFFWAGMQAEWFRV